jgi:hypothetical protein
MVDKMESISNRFESALGADRKASSILLTRRLISASTGYSEEEGQTYRSTLLSDDVLRRRRSASVKCSLLTTAAPSVSTGTLVKIRTIMPELCNELIAVPYLLLEGS